MLVESSGASGRNSAIPQDQSVANFQPRSMTYGFPRRPALQVSNLSGIRLPMRDARDYLTHEAVALFLDRMKMDDRTPAIRGIALKAVDEIMEWLDRLDQSQS